MTKKRKSVFDVNTSKKEIDDAAIHLQKQTFEKQPHQQREISSTGSVLKEERPKHLYVSSAFHQQSKIQASMRGMKLREYIEWLIEKDKPQITY